MSIQEKIDRALQNHTSSETYRGFVLQTSHDGFTKDGEPESDLYDLLVWDDDTIINYHYENWFTVSCATEQFEIQQEYPAQQFLQHNLYCVRAKDFRKH